MDWTTGVLLVYLTLTDCIMYRFVFFVISADIFFVYTIKPLRVLSILPPPRVFYLFIRMLSVQQRRAAVSTRCSFVGPSNGPCLSKERVLIPQFDE